MTATINPLISVSSHFEKEEYLPIKIVFDSSYENIRHIGFYYEDTDLAEFTVDRTNGLVKKFVLVQCTNYTFSNHSMEIPKIEKTGALTFNYDSKFDCKSFSATVFSDGVMIELSDMKADSFCKCGQLILGFDSRKRILSIYITELSKDEIEHIIFELREQ